MKNCTDCKYAKWDKTKTGRLHPSGVGRCKFPYIVRPLPAAFHWASIFPPAPSGGGIDRRTELKDHCFYYAPQKNNRT